MITKEMIQRINELAAKKKDSGLTSAEQKEQNELRQEYLGTIRQRLKHTLDGIEIVDEPKQAFTLMGDKDNLKVMIPNDSPYQQ